MASADEPRIPSRARTFGVVVMLTLAYSAARAQPPTTRTALFPIVVKTKNADQVRLARLVDGLILATSEERRVELLHTAILSERLQDHPLESAARCGSEPVCLGRLGRRIHADRVVVGRAFPTAAGINVRFLVVSVEKMEITTTVDLTFTDADGEAAVHEAFESLFGQAQPPAAEPPP